MHEITVIYSDLWISPASLIFHHTYARPHSAPQPSVWTTCIGCEQDCYGLLSSLISQLSVKSDSCYNIVTHAMPSLSVSPLTPSPPLHPSPSHSLFNLHLRTYTLSTPPHPHKAQAILLHSSMSSLTFTGNSTNGTTAPGSHRRRHSTASGVQ